MKTFFRVILILVLLLVVAVFGLNLFLEKGLTPAIQKALPAVEEKLGAPVSVGKASVSLFQGSVVLEDVSVGNPEGFNQPHLFSLARSVQDIALWPLITKQEIRVEEVTIENSDLTVVRNKDGLINLEVILANLKKGADETTEPAPEEKPEEQPEQEPTPLPPFELEQLFVSSLLTYVQEKSSGEPFNLGLQLKITGKEIGTIGEPTDRGTLSIVGNLAGNQELFVINLDGKIAPITDPLKPTFEIEGKVNSVQLTMFEIFQKDFKINGGMMGLDMTLHAKDGVFDPEKSQIRVLINQPDLGSGLGLPAGFQPASLTFPVKVSGTVQEPKVNFMAGLKEGIKNAIASGVGIDQMKEQATAAASDAKAKAEEAAASAKEKAKSSLDSLKEGKLPNLKNDSSESEGTESEEKKGIDSILGGFGK